MSFFWGLLLGFFVGMFYSAYRSNEDKKTEIE